MFKTSLYNNGNRDNSFPNEFEYVCDLVFQIRQRGMSLVSSLGDERKFQNVNDDVLYVTLPT